MKKLRYILVCLIFSCSILAQEQDTIVHDLHALQYAPDSIVTEDAHEHDAFRDWKPDPMRAVWMGAIFPGLGQIENRSYWKLPIVYGAFMGCAYAITWNSGMYNDYKAAYQDITTDVELSTDPKRSYNAVLPKGYTINMMGGRNMYTNTLSNKTNLYRRYRDYSILATVIVYALSLIDAYVDAQLFDFDISTDLSMDLQPQIYHDIRNQRSAEVKLAITIK